MERKHFLKLLTFLPIIAEAKGLERLLGKNFTFDNSQTMPVFFIGHGDPNNAFLDNPFTQSLRRMAASLPQKPSAILVISAHWQSLDNTFISTKSNYTSSYYPVQGASGLAGSFLEENPTLQADDQRELDHGAWAILKHLSPNADIPVMEMSIDLAKPLNEHWKLAQQLNTLRNKGVLIIGSGNIVHNLELSTLHMFSQKPYGWALEFDEWVKKKIDDRDFLSLLLYQQQGKMARKSVPTLDHYLPMLYALALMRKNEPITHTYEEVFAGISMRCFRIG
ncbi:4,5-DOPA dioxygenase extradiol [Chitinophaga skermanii]|uniref:4,5-DOPA dioxygenase extradiol n=1 Tax=Chitinophaga skermanii TaxID=331697 RepID=A0A327R3D0_9BACT|nr:class III extradiol ring-cleavage dioxygenase [Chitinophaga skermanii]RAJ11161.1 4,5-DOPA dioxygenase extradiol [Chitinophaga skermanii]